MNKTSPTIALLALACASSILLLASDASVTHPQESQDTAPLAYHDHAPTEPLPAILDPAQFSNNHPAFVTYTLAARMKEVLYQVPCYCPCRKNLGHQSLLDCYTSTHGVRCPTCQKEVLFCYLQHKKGKTSAQIRDAMSKGKAKKIDLDKNVERFYAELLASQK
jgi:Protein of unknown function with PCYCGC motif